MLAKIEKLSAAQGVMRIKSSVLSEKGKLAYICLRYHLFPEVPAIVGMSDKEEYTFQEMSHMFGLKSLVTACKQLAELGIISMVQTGNRSYKITIIPSYRIPWTKLGFTEEEIRGEQTEETKTKLRRKCRV